MTPQDEADLRRLILAEYRKSEYIAATCAGKEKFDSLDRADRVAKAMGFRHNNRIVAYRCMVCGEWHIGNARPDSPVVVRRMQAKKGRSGVYSS